MRDVLRGILGGWQALGKRAFFLFTLVAGSAGLGFLISWPLWYFATFSRGVYTVITLALAGAGLATLGVRAVLRSGKAPGMPGRRKRGFPGAIISVLRTLLALAGLYAVVVLFTRRLWPAAVPALLLWLGLVGWIAFTRGAKRGLDKPRIPAENRHE